MNRLPVYIEILFIFGTLLTILLLYKSTNYSRPSIIIVLSWLALQSIVSLSGFYTVTNVRPPRFALLLLPPIAFIASMFFTKNGKRLIDGYDVKTLTLLHIVRIPIEFTLYWLFLQNVIPKIMTFEGRNFDILCGLTAPFVYYFGYVKNMLSRNVLIAWNVVCLLLLVNIVITAVLSAPLPFQQFAFDQPNIAMLYFPYTLLPCCLVPIVLLAHLVAIRRLLIIQ
ncbi:MAG TPA: hypothetical protein VF974_02405 [Patescibacteria group bacterium]